MSYSHFTTFERGQLEALYKLGYFTRTIKSGTTSHKSRTKKMFRLESQV